MKLQCSYCQTMFDEDAQGNCPQCGRPLVMVEDDKPVNSIVQMQDQGRLEKL